MDMVTSSRELTLTATEFKAKCLDLFKQLADNRLTQVTVTRRGTPIAVVKPPRLDEATARASYGSMAGTVHIAPGVDITRPIFDGVMDAELGILHR